MPWYERDWTINIDIVLFETILMGHFKGVPVAFCSQQCGVGAATFNQRVGCQGSAVNNQTNFGRSNARTVHDGCNAVKHGSAWVVIGGQQFRRETFTCR